MIGDLLRVLRWEDILRLVGNVGIDRVVGDKGGGRLMIEEEEIDEVLLFFGKLLCLFEV